MRSSVLDLGSNSFHVLVADLDGRAVSPVLREREMLHLGRVVAEHGHVPDDNRKAAVATVAHLAELARRAGAQQRLAVATAALRDAANGAEVIEQLADAAGTEVRVLDGDEEARLGYLGVRAAVALRTEPTLVLDLGGGSLELTIGVADRVAWSTSLPLGASRLSPVLANDPPKSKELRALTALVHDAIDEVTDAVLSHTPQTIVAIGGTVRALGRITAARTATWLPATLNQYRVLTTELADIRDELTRLDLDDRLDVPGMKSKRADHIHVAAVVVADVLERLGITEVVVCDWGLREGLLLDSHGISTVPSATELRSGEVERIRHAFVPDDPHPQHVAMLARQLFDATRELHGLGPVDRELLDHAASLHSIGESIALRRQQLHGAYLVTNAELRGFSPKETAQLATLVRFQRSRGIDASFPAYAALDPEAAQRTERLLALLQVADGLDRAHDQAVTNVTVERDDGRVRLSLTGAGLHVTDDELARKTRMFERVYDVEVVVTDLAG